MNVLSTVAGRVSRLDELALGIRDQALAAARGHVGAGQGGAELPALFQTPEFTAHFLRALAAGVAHVLAANDRYVLAVYASECVPDDDQLCPPAGPLAHLFVLVRAPSAALAALVSSLNRGLSASLDELPPPLGGRTEAPLDISLMTEHDVQHGVGVARLLAAVHPPPVRLWQRPAAPHVDNLAAKLA